MRCACVCLLLCGALVAGCASSKGESYAVVGYDFGAINKVAITSVTGQVHGDAAKNSVSNLFTMELMKKGYAVIERADVQKLLKEQEFQASAITSNQDAARAGQILNVPAVIMINIDKYTNEKIEMTAKMVEVEDGMILWIGNGSGTTGRAGATALGAVAGAVLGGTVAGDSSSDRLLGAVIGGAAGGAAGYALSPEQRAQVQKVITKVCESLPSRYIPQPPMQSR